jgi:hypothetical protein
VADAVDHFVDALGGQPVELVMSEGAAAHREERFGTDIGEWTHARSQSAGEYYALHDG